MELISRKRKLSWTYIGIFIFLGILTISSADAVDHLYVSNGSHILRMSMVNEIIRLEESVYNQPGGRIVGLAVDVDENLLFWSDLGRTHHAIYRSRLDGTKVNIIVTDVSECNGLSVDWISKHLYWTDAGHRTVEVANYDGSGRRILVASGLINPRGIVVDPVFGFVFWADQGTKKIERTWLDGSERKVLVAEDLSWPNQMAVSYSTRRVYWVDAKKQVIMSCDQNGNEVTVERRVVEATQGNPVFGLVVIGNKAIISTWFSPKISSTYVAIEEPLWRDEVNIPHSTELYSLVSTASSMQPGSFHPCGQKDKGDCSHLCLPTRGTGYKCACPSFGGLALSFNAKSCEAPSELLFFTLKNSGEVGFISLRGAQSTYLTLAGRSTSPSAVTYDPIKQVVYWSDVDEHAIFSASLAGTGTMEIFLNSSDGLGVVEAMALDWKSGQLYFTNTGQSTPGLDGALYSWHRLERISLDKRDRQTVVSDLDRPRGISLDTDNGLLFYADWSKTPRIVRCFLDGSNRTVILDRNLNNPNGLSFYNGRLYVADAHYTNQSGPPHLMLYDGETNEWTQLKLSSNVSLPIGLAVQGDTLYYSDWVSADSPTGYVKSYNLRFGVDNNVILSGKRPTGLHYSPLARRRQEASDDLCQKAQCSHNCVRVPLGSPRKNKCTCPDQSSLVMSKNRDTCIRPDNFLLVADLNTIRLLSLDDHTQVEAQTLWYSDATSNFVALAYDDVSDTVFWSDLTTKSIYSSPFLDFKPQLVYKADYYIDGLTVDTGRSRLFWTGYDSDGTGLIARLNLQRGLSSYHVILDGLSNPRAVHLYLDKKLIFWTEYGGKTTSASVNKAKANGRNPRMLLSNGLFWPNALATFKNKLYVADGAGKVFVIDFMGENLEEVRFMTGSTKHIFGLVVMDTVLFYSDWFTHSVYMVDRMTGQKETIVPGLSRPTSVVVHHPTNLTVKNQCQTEEQKCAETCIPVPKSFHCTCSVGSKLAADGFNCIKMASPWEVTKESKCFNLCHEHAYCSQLVPLTKYQCVCKDGYEGNGFRCKECETDFHKPLLGNDTCYPCPVDSSTQGTSGASHCVCNYSSHRMVNGHCTDITTTTTTTGITTVITENDTKDFEGMHTTDMPIWTTDSHMPDDKILGGTAGQPFFENCPHGETMRMRLGDSSSQVYIPVNWVARDAYGKPLMSLSNFEQQDGKILIPWVANGDAGIQTVVFEATDNWMQTATCQFQVLLEDFVRPKFTMCPDNIVKTTSVNREPVDWTAPVAIDNVKQPTVITTHERRSEFGIGTTLVQYTATDSAGNTATCVFNVTLIDEHPCNVTEMKNGGFVCSTSERGDCQIVCDKDYVLNPLNVFPKSFNCADEDSISALKKVMSKWEPCLRKRRPTTARQEFSLTFQGDCRPEDLDLKRELRSKVINKLEEKQLCTGAVCSHSPISILCNPQLKRRRYAEDKFNMTWNVTIEYIEGLSPGQVWQIVTDLKFELKKLIAHLTFFLKRHQYKLLPGSVSTIDFEWLCSPGEMVTKDGCVACPPGSFLNSSSDVCMLCEPGMYQNASSQESCLACPVGYTLDEGAITINECQTFPAINKMTKFFIIAACCIAFVFLCLVLLLYLQYTYHTRKTKNASTSSNNVKYSNPNVYAQAPVMKQKCPDYIRNSSRDFFMSSHDYEDIDNHNNSTFETFTRRPPGCRDSLCSFKAHTDMTFLPSPRDSNGPSPFLYSDETGLPRSPRESAKSISIHGEGYPYGTLGSFKGSPPPSPYRSLHLAANGPIPKGTPESPSHTSQTLNSLLGDESPYTSRLIRDRLIDPDSPYRIISQDRRTPVPESPYKITRRIDSDSPYRASSDIGMESPYRSPAIQRHISSGIRTTPEMHHSRSPGFAYVTDSQHSLRSVPESPQFQHKLLPSNEEPSAFVPVGDFLYKRPPSPLSPPTSSRKSNDSLPRSPSTPRASPGMSRKRMDKSQRTPPQRRKVRNEYGLYEYE